MPMVLQDKVQSYFGMRKISLGTVPGESNPRIMLNNMFLFQMGVLDQVSRSPNAIPSRDSSGPTH